MLFFYLVEKYELTEDEYAKRTDTVQSYLKRNKMGKYNEEEMKKMEEQKAQQLKEEKEIAANFKIGDRCEVDVPGTGGKRRGVVKFIGETLFKTDVLWVGVQYDEPLGKNDGSVEGKRYLDILRFLLLVTNTVTRPAKQLNLILFFNSLPILQVF